MKILNKCFLGNLKISFFKLSSSHLLSRCKLILIFCSLLFISNSCFSWTQSSATNVYSAFILYSNGYIYGVTGGYYDGYNIQWSKVSSDGSLSDWSNGDNFPSNSMGGEVFISYGSYIYLSGGWVGYYWGEIDSFNSVSMISVNQDGTLGEEVGVNGMTSVREGHSMVAYNGYIYAVGGYINHCCDCCPAPPQYQALTSVEFAAINNDGTLSNWQQASTLITISGSNLSWASNGYLWVMSGNILERSLINSDGSLAGWEFINNPFGSVPSNITYASDGYLYGFYMLGGVQRVQINSDGTFGSLQTLESLTTEVTSVLSANDYVYAIGSDGNVYYRPADGPPIFLDFTNSSDTSQFIYESLSNTSSQPTISWISTYNGATGIMQIQFTAPNQGIKMTLVKSEWASSVSSTWYEMKAQVCADDTTYPNDLFAVGVLYNGDSSPPMDIAGHGLYSLASGWNYLYDFQQSYGGTSMYPQLTFKNNDVYPATMYLESVEVKPITPPGN